MVKFKITLLFIILNIALLASCPAFSKEQVDDNSVLGQLNKIETSYFLRSFDQDSIFQRIKRLEEDLFGKKRSGPILQRLASIKKTLKNRKNIMDKINPEEENLVSTVQDHVNNEQITGLNQEANPTNNKNRKKVEYSRSMTLEEIALANAKAEDEEKKKKNTSKNTNNKESEPPPEFDPYAEDYLDILMYVNKDKVIRFKNMPIKVFLPAGNNMTYREEYRQAVIRAMNIWKLKSNGDIDYVLVNNPKIADVKVIWQDMFPEYENKVGEAGTSYGININRAAAGSILSNAGGFAPGYYGYGASLLGALVAGLGNTTKIRDARLNIGTMSAMKLDGIWAMNVIESIASHEYGHSIGITGHSINPEDIMFQDLQTNGILPKVPSKRDINTVIKLYEQEPDITE